MHIGPLGGNRVKKNLLKTPWGGSYDIGPSPSAIWALFVLWKFLRNEPQSWRSCQKTLKMAILGTFAALWRCHRNAGHKKAAPPAINMYLNAWKKLFSDNLIFDITWHYVRKSDTEKDTKNVFLAPVGVMGVTPVVWWCPGSLELYFGACPI